jgi:hypothetical protein
MSDLLHDLQGWYAEQCDGEWEHTYGVEITTCDNPGWWVKIDLAGTELRTRPFDRIADQVDASGFQQGERWLHCYVKDEVWHGAGDETKLAVILKTFLDWANHRGVSHER